ncbi:hypothetical protein PP657_gp102 [Bacillus phage BCPST]|uniref:Uncharacterized protein n=1 Tax=Bacillus phage BCPST TaxID=2801506 RepID=A0AAE7P9T7_9CAUD|nr:hypothetical protein PP657_gp102 [Bacillus phage BCPST]QQO38720.1 hypothetical protein BCPST_102 [Bacillus phage BCPST]QSJ04309.1 hypothetical protein BCP6_105 [Bacillus phage BCP6]
MGLFFSHFLENKCGQVKIVSILWNYQVKGVIK